MTDLLKDIIETSRERIKTPITGAFITAFLIFNWRPILLLMFSETSIEDKIVVINAEYCLMPALLWPLAIAVFYVAGIPYIMMLIEFCTKKAIEGRKTHKNNQILFDLKNEKAIASEEFQIEKIKTGHKEISDLHNTIETLNSQIETMNTQNKLSTENYESLLESSVANQENLQNIINELHGDLEYEKKEFNLLLKFSELENLLNLSMDEKKYFVEFSDFKFFNKNNSLWSDEKLIQMFIDKELIERTEYERDYNLTSLGSRFYKYLTNTKK